MTIRIPVQTIIDPKTDSGLTSYNTTISKVPTSVANVFVTSVQNNTTQVNTNVQQTFTNANAAAGVNGQIQFNDRNVLAGDPGLTYNKDTDSLTVLGNVTTGTIRTNNLRYMNGDPMMFSYSNANVAECVVGRKILICARFSSSFYGCRHCTSWNTTCGRINYQTSSTIVYANSCVC